MDDCLCVCEYLKAASAVCERQLNESLTGLDVSHCQAQVLMKIHGDKMSMSALSKDLCCHKSNVTQIVDGLDKRGLIERIVSPEDRRVCELKLTPKGVKICGELKSVLKKQASKCMSVFNDDEKATLSMLLKRYIDQMK